MQVSFRKSFLKDIKKIKDSDTLKLIEKVIIEAEQAKLLADIKGLEKLTGYKGYFRIKRPPYRIGIYSEKSNMEFVAFGTRENFYNSFP